MPIALRSLCAQRDGHQRRRARCADAGGPRRRRGVYAEDDARGLLVAHQHLRRAHDEVPVDELLLPARGVAQAHRGDAVDLSERALRAGVQLGKGIVGEERVGRAGGAEAVAHVLGGVFDACAIDQEAMVDAREQRPIRAPGEVALELWQADEDEGEKRARVRAAERVPAFLISSSGSRLGSPGANDSITRSL